jgi:hypothetical protein
VGEGKLTSLCISTLIWGCFETKLGVSTLMDLEVVINLRNRELKTSNRRNTKNNVHFLDFKK